MIIGTAGHIDHGKTTLVRALTGVDTDRLPQEKARGISIELGYAYVTLEDGTVLGYVDVPGHERLVRTMAAGACGIDFALLVVAADDGIMPQTREHLAILELLGVCRGAVAVTKADRVDAARLRQVEAEVNTLLAGTPLAEAPLFPLDAAAVDDSGVAALRRHLHAAAAQFAPRESRGLFRMAVDRVFTLAGHGTVVTGTVFSGSVSAGAAVTVVSANAEVRVRAIHAQNRSSASARAGQRCALNVAGIDKSRISRGDWLADAGALGTSQRMDVRLRLLPESNQRIVQGSPLHVHLATAHHVAQVFLLEGAELRPGQSARAQLVFQELGCALPGDRFIARDAQAARTVGGGVVLDPCAPARRRRRPERLRWLEALERSIAGEGVEPLLEQAPHGVTMRTLVRLTGRAPDSIALPAAALAVPAEQETFVLLRDRWDALRERAVQALRDFHAGAPDEPGPDAGRLRRIAMPDVPPALWDSLVDALAREEALRRNGPWLQAPEHEIALTERDRELAERLQPLISSGRFDPPWVRDLACAVDEPDERVREVLRKRVRQGSVFQVVRDLFYDSRCIGELADIAAALARDEGAVHAARYRDAIGLGRKRAIQILEFFDRIGYTRRLRHVHVLREDSQMARRIQKTHAGDAAAALRSPTRAPHASG